MGAPESEMRAPEMGATETITPTANVPGFFHVEQWLDWLEATGRQPTSDELSAVLNQLVGDTSNKR